MSVRALMRDATSGRWLAFAEPVAVLAAARLADVAATVAEAQARARHERLHAVGFLTYEAAPALDPGLAAHAPGALPPAWFALFREARPTAPPAPCESPALHWQPSLDRSGYCRALARVRRYIGAGDTYQVNFSYRLRSRVDPAVDHAERLFSAMTRRQPAGLGAFIDSADWSVCCASHELFFLRHGRRLTSRPMKGTAPRGSGPAEDRQQADWLRASLKNRAENLMITDMVRNDMGRIADTGSVRVEALFQLEAYPTVWQMTSTVHGDTDADVAAVLRALFPAASITGAPKRRTMEIIRELEDSPREIYTGTIGMIHPDGDAQFNVAIRTAWVDKRTATAEYGVGGGILWDSDPDEEHRETLTKARILEAEPAAPFALLETLLWQPQRGFWLLDAHLERLQAAARHFFGRPLETAAIIERLESLAVEFPSTRHRVRLLVDAHQQISVSAAVLDDATRPRRVALARSRAALAGNPLVLHKTTHRVVYESARCALAAAVPDADDVLMVNERGELTESTIANLVLDLNGELATPPVSSGLLPGVYRRHLLESGRVVERVLMPAHLRAARAVYLANSVRGLWRVEFIDR